MSYAISPPATVSLPIAGSDDRFPVRRIYCVGRNYAAHAREMGFDPGREPPFFFAKPADALRPVAPGETLALPMPSMTANFHHEVELVAAIGSGGRDIAAGEALGCVWGYAVGLDMTRRDLQAKMRDSGRPWEIAKSFDASAPIGPLHNATGPFDDAAIWLSVNGALRQSSNVKEMTWSVAEIIADLSRYFRLEPGDLIYTGTPEGVGPVVVGDRIEAGIDGLGAIAVEIMAR